MKIVITGAGGQLGKELIQIFKNAGYTVIPFNKEQLDITNRTQIKEMIEKLNPNYIINSGAFTQVDLCETQVEQAYLINGIGPYYLACEAKEKKVKFLHVSTDYVFNGEKVEPYVEDDIPIPRTVYGKSKQIGEALALAANESTTIIRTSWLYGHGGNNFVNTIKTLARHSQEIRVVNDQYGSPTYTKDLGLAILKLLKKSPGIYHVTNSGSCSWFELATEIIKHIKSHTVVIPVSTEEYGLKTPRPLYSVLNNKKLNNEGIFLQSWKDGLHEYLLKESEDIEN